MTYSDYSTALVTGASSGMGEATVRMFVARGLTVHAVARDGARLDALADSLGVIPHAVDLADTDAIESELGGLRVDVLVNSAGVSRQGNVLTSTRSDLDAMVDVNLRAVLHLTRLFLPGMVDRDLGHIVNISSIAGHYNFFGHTAYHATKAAIHQVSRQLRNDTLGKRIRVTEISPGRVETEIFGRNLGGSPEAMKEAWATYFEGYESLTTDDIVSAIDFALSAPRHANIGLIEIMPTFQVPGGLTFDRRAE
ncbi:SDR family oxidoreductase [Brooklawnia cerclae]|uniref:NADP-dependent 3-hydroxy acid dehydrogenase YdfG n=1 Tax=Brooklawnia cerclae TaxID=349934 RepID=A0ABX0SI06_9ACTN|nr:SDR family oxidoreductase [Brooklawnia cerclae]NIH57610.1 NADP-dependent 3-hydroxy acid dehydrogenase YdfG [Brooklawnia cerclae]